MLRNYGILHRGHSPVTVLTSSMEASDQRACNHHGVTEFLQKPSSLSKFIEIVQNIKSAFLSYSNFTSNLHF